MTKPKKPKARTRRIHPSEVDLMLKVLNYEMGTVPTLPQHYVAWGFILRWKQLCVVVKS